MALVLCPLHGQQGVVFVYEEDARCFPLDGNAEIASNWTVFITYLEGLIEWHILVKTERLKYSNLESIGEGMIGKSRPMCKKCVERVFGSLWKDLDFEKFISA